MSAYRNDARVELAPEGSWARVQDDDGTHVVFRCPTNQWWRYPPNQQVGAQGPYDSRDAAIRAVIGGPR